MLSASIETAPIPTIKTTKAIGSQSIQRNNIGETSPVSPIPAGCYFMDGERATTNKQSLLRCEITRFTRDQSWTFLIGWHDPSVLAQDLIVNEGGAKPTDQ